MIESEFDKEVLTNIRSRLNSRRMHYDVFTFSGDEISVNIHIPDTHIRVIIPFIIMKENGHYVVLFEEKEYEFNNVASGVSFIVSMARKEESRITKIKRH